MKPRPILHRIDAWTVTESPYAPGRNDYYETIFTLANGRFGVRGTPAEGFSGKARNPGSYAAGVYAHFDAPHEWPRTGFAEKSDQLVDVVLIEQKRGRKPKEICDGFEHLRAHNLVTYKSMRESLNLWALQELMGHYVNYRKKEGLRKVKAGDVGLYAICTRSSKAVSKQLSLEPCRPGIYDGNLLGEALRVIVLSEIAEESRNAIWALFSAQAEKVGWGKEHYHWHMDDWSGIMQQLWEFYDLEGVEMPYTLEQWRRDFVLDHLGDVPAEERVKGLPAEDRLEGLSAEEIEAYLNRIRRRRRKQRQRRKSQG